MLYIHGPLDRIFNVFDFVDRIFVRVVKELPRIAHFVLNLLLALVLFLSTFWGRVFLVGFVLSFTAVVWMMGHIAVFPIVFNLAIGAWVRRVIFFTLIALTPLFARRKVKKWAKQAFLKWKRAHVAVRVVTNVVLISIAAVLLTIYFGWTTVSMFLPLPIFVAVFIEQKLPRLLIEFISRQGVGKTVIDGGYHILPARWRVVLRRMNRKIANRIMSCRLGALNYIRRDAKPRKPRHVVVYRPKSTALVIVPTASE